MTHSQPLQPWWMMLRRALNVAVGRGRAALGVLLLGWAVWVAPSALAEAVCTDEGDPHAQAVLESRYPYTYASYTRQPARAEAQPLTAATPAKPSTQARALLAFASGMRLWIGTARAHGAHAPQDLWPDTPDGGMTCEGGQSCDPASLLAAAHPIPTTEAAPPPPNPEGPACVLGEPGCDLPTALFAGASASSSLDMPWLYPPSGRLAFALRATWPLPAALPPASAPYIAPTTKRLSDRLDRPPRA